MDAYRWDRANDPDAGVPAAVVRVRSTEDVQAVMRLAAETGTAVIPRGAGSGLSGGTSAVDGAIVLSLDRMREIHVDADTRMATVQPGAFNAEVKAAASAHGLWYPPDPSSFEFCSIGGNVATNAGGLCCVKYGVTRDYVLGMQVVTGTGELVRLGRRTAKGVAGYDLAGLMVGSEGTLGVVTRVTVRLTRLPQDVRTVLAGFPDTDAAGAATSAIISAGIVPAAIEMMDALAIEAAEEAVHCGYPEGAGAVLVIELDGPSDDVAQELDEVLRLCGESAAFETRLAADDVERALIWKGRKSAFAAVGRISPDYIVQDGVIPRTALSRVLRQIAELGESGGCRVANVFHAGDGNLHPLVLFDGSIEGATERAEEVAGGILDLCISNGGSITGEHGVGADKARYMPRMFSDDDLDTMQAVRCAFDPDNISNPGKIFPTPRLCGERPGRHQGAHPLQEAGLGEVF